MNKKNLILLLFPFLVVQIGHTQQDQPLWLLPIIEEITNETDFCERCTWLPPIITRVEFNEDFYYFLRYGCSISDNFARMYELDGTVVGECKTVNGDNNCEFGFNAFTIYTLSEIIIPIWNCETGFDCDFAREIGVEQYVPITIDESQCAAGIKTLSVSQEYVSYEWMGDNLSSTRSFIDITAGGTYQVKVTDLDGCPITGSITIPDIAALQVDIKGPKKVCATGAVELVTAPYASYQWSTGQTTAAITATQADTYTVTVTNEENCQGVASFTLEEHAPLELIIQSTTTTIKEGEEVQLSLEAAQEAAQITEQVWSGNGLFTCEDCSETIYRPLASGAVTATVTDSRGCTASAQTFLEVKELPLEIYAPNVFSPRGSGGNSTFTIFSGTNVLEIKKLVIFDRWGTLVFENANFLPNQPRVGWNGRLRGRFVAQDVYLFKADVVFTNGQTKMFTGDVLVID